MTKAVVLVPHLNGIEEECDDKLRQLATKGIKVTRRRGCSAIDVARNEMLSDALHDGYEEILFIDADVSFRPDDAIKLIERPELVISGVYAKKSRREFASTFAPEIKEVVFGPKAPESYPLLYSAAGFLRIKAEAARRMIEELKLPKCNTQWGRGVWPFFMPLIIPKGAGLHYLPEDWAFSHRLREIGITPLADTSFRLYHWGLYGFTWEEAGNSQQRFESYTHRFV